MKIGNEIKEGTEDQTSFPSAAWKMFTCWFCLIAVNFIWQAITGCDWNVAAERSFFQGIALNVFLFVWERGYTL